MHDPATVLRPMSSRLRGVLEPGVADRLARLACRVAGAPAAVVLAGEGEGAVVAGSFGWDGTEPVPGMTGAKRGRRGPSELTAVASLPLVSPERGATLGTLVVLDRRPREWTAAERASLEDVAAAAAGELGRRRREGDGERGSELERERTARTRAEAGEKRFAFLAEVSALLDASLDYEDSFQKLARLVVPALADYCLIDEAEPNGGLRRIARAHADPEKEKILYTNTQHSPEADDADLARHPVLRVIRTGLPLLVADFTPDMVGVIAHDDDHRGRLARLDLKSYIIAPLIARGRVLGAITLAASDSGRRYRAPDVALVEEVARRAALAIDNARLYTLAQQALRAREAVLAVVSHDLRNPLASILLNASMLLDMAPAGTLQPWMEENLRQVVGSVEQTNRLITDLLDVSRMEESGGIPLDRSPVDARTLVAVAVRMLQPVAVARGVSLAARTGEPLPVLADSDRVVQVLWNLIGNAVKFTDAGGEVRVSVERREGELRFTVADTGVGIAPEHQPYVFDRFRQVAGDRRGVGLGLPIARGIVEAHGGRIWLESRLGAGTTVHFTLPPIPSDPGGGAADA
ncbi:MAG TPA: GAF domain-containing sensor histidine kinase [Longimicrobium sp.]|jgi:signal transduction histidine kinase|nr:GAF domain-containing sensor histidine kinase [Longimicrobium sp.]